MLKYESRVPPGASKCVVNQEGGILEIIIPVEQTAGHWVMMIFPMVWMAGWLSFPPHGNAGPSDLPVPPIWFPLIVLVPFFLMGLCGLGGVEILKIAEGRGTLSFRLFGLTLYKKIFPAASLLGIRKTDPEKYDCQFTLSHIVGGGRQPTLIFTHDYWEICFGSGMDPAEAKEILAMIQEHLRAGLKNGDANG